MLINYEPGMQYSLNGGNNYLENQKEKTKRESTLQVLTSQLICIHWVNISKKGRRNIFETVVKVEKPRKSITIPTQEADLDGLGYLQGKEVDFVNTKAFEGTLLAHTDGDVPNLVDLRSQRWMPTH